MAAQGPISLLRRYGDTRHDMRSAYRPDKWYRVIDPLTHEPRSGGRVRSGSGWGGSAGAKPGYSGGEGPGVRTWL